jgi:predicted nuclease with TOPRIM domain
MKLNVIISAGEFLDKISILEIKSLKIKDPEKIKNIKKELELLQLIASEKLSDYKNLNQRLLELKAVNSKLWEIEDDIRIKESKKEFDEEFIRLARAVYVTNDERFEVKNLINTELGSLVKEEKGYEKY